MCPPPYTLHSTLEVSNPSRACVQASSTAAPGDCTNGQYYGNPAACEKFFICVNGQRVEQHCASGLVWNQETSMCDWRFNVKCGDEERDDRESPRPGCCGKATLLCVLCFPFPAFALAPYRARSS